MLPGHDKSHGDETVGDVAYRRIRADIVSGKWRPGDKLKIDALKRQYEVGASTVREILNRLATEGFSLAEGQRGFEVAAATPEELRELADLRLVLENHAISLSFTRGDLDWEAQIVAAHHRLASAERALLDGEKDRTLDWVAYDFAFHHALISACGSASLLAIHATIFDRFMRYHMLAESFRGIGVSQDHKTLADIAMKRDATAAQSLLATHINAGVDHILGSGRI